MEEHLVKVDQTTFAHAHFLCMKAMIAGIIDKNQFQDCLKGVWAHTSVIRNTYLDLLPPLESKAEEGEEGEGEEGEAEEGAAEEDE